MTKSNQFQIILFLRNYEAHLDFKKFSESCQKTSIFANEGKK